MDVAGLILRPARRVLPIGLGHRRDGLASALVLIYRSLSALSSPPRNSVTISRD
jgi:hypothetical protein